MTTPTPTAKQTRTGIALAVSAGLHVIFALAVFVTATGTAPRGVADPFRDGEAVEVMLAGREGARTAAMATGGENREVADLEALARRLDARSSLLMAPEPARQRGDLSALFDAIGRLDARGRQGDGRDAWGNGRPFDRDLTRATAARGQATLDASAGELWGQVEPCWRRLTDRSTAPVTLEITLDADGGLAAAPRIIRTGPGRPSEQRLLAEARALEAIRACLPYRAPSLKGVGRVYRLAFQPSANTR